MHMWKSEILKHPNFGAVLEVDMLKKCTPLWHEAHLEVRSATFSWQAKYDTAGNDSTLKYNYNYSKNTLQTQVQRQLHHTSLDYTTLHFTGSTDTTTTTITTITTTTNTLDYNSAMMLQLQLQQNYTTATVHTYNDNDITLRYSRT